jgi:hypothetical protein
MLNRYGICIIHLHNGLITAQTIFCRILVFWSESLAMREALIGSGCSRVFPGKSAI